MRTILHIDFNSYFARVEQQANPRLRGKPIGVTGGDRMKRTVVGAASVEAKKFGVKTGMNLYEARKLCPQLILVKGDSDKYLSTTKKFLNILKSYSPYIELFSIDEAFIELPQPKKSSPKLKMSSSNSIGRSIQIPDQARLALAPAKRVGNDVIEMAIDIKSQIRAKIGEWITCSIGISYNKFLAKLAGSLYKPDGLLVIADEQAAMRILDQIELNEVCGIGFRIKRRLNNMGIFNFSDLRRVNLEYLLASFKSYGQTLYNMSRGLDDSPVSPFYEKEEVKSIGHRHTIDHDADSYEEIKQILLKLSELVARRMRAKKLVGKTVSLWFRYAFKQTYNPGLSPQFQTGIGFLGDGAQSTVSFTSDGLEIFKTGWGIFMSLWDEKAIRMIGISISNLKPTTPENLNLLPEVKVKEVITKALDKINDKFGEFTLQRGVLLNSVKVYRKANPFLADRRFKL
ncbi:DNA polymerase IV [Candidatus Daviesbacteria bacterium]|nr:DNA polymerase IV [Candidatus Daviesbacteria bacterium]